MSDIDIQVPTPTSSSLHRRVLRMAAAWAIIGMVTGAGLASQDGGLIGIVAVVLAGMVEMALIGAILALIGGRPKESLLGAGCGALAGLLLGTFGGEANVSFTATFGLVVGALTGATLRPYLRLLCLPVFLLNRLLPRSVR